MRNPTWAQVLAGAERAAERVRRWPDWMLALSPSTAHVLREREAAQARDGALGELLAMLDSR